MYGWGIHINMTDYKPGKRRYLCHSGPRRSCRGLRLKGKKTMERETFGKQIRAGPLRTNGTERGL